MSLGPTNKTRLGTLLLTAVPVTALGLATGAGAGAPLLVVGAIALAVGTLLGAMLAGSVPTPATVEPAHSPRHRPFGVRALLSRAAHEAGPSLDEVAVRVDVAPPRLRTVGDPECLHRAVSDLIAQAARRSPPGGVVTLAARSASTGVRLEVVDEGKGDCAKDLANVRRIVHRHGGALRAERARPRGCRVVLELPGV